MSEFGKQALLNSGSDGHHIPFGIDFSIWREPIENEREKMRQVLGIDDDTFVILTVADNQERKNLDAAFNIVSKFAVDIEERNQNGFVTKKTNKRKVKWILVTRLQSNIGWDLTDLPSRYGIQDILVLYERGIPVKNLWGLYIISDIFLLTSKAEGLAIPILEAMATGLLCVATNFAAMHEHLTDDRGYLIDTDYHWFDVFGNSERVLVDIEDGVKKLEMVYNESDQEKNTIRERALEYVKKRTWEKSTQMLMDVIDKVKGNS